MHDYGNELMRKRVLFEELNAYSVGENVICSLLFFVLTKLTEYSIPGNDI